MHNVTQICKLYTQPLKFISPIRESIQVVFAKAVDFSSASRKQKINFPASTASSKEQCSTTINEITAMFFCHPKLYKK